MHLSGEEVSNVSFFVRGNDTVRESDALGFLVPRHSNGGMTMGIVNLENVVNRVRIPRKDSPSMAKM
jgi:cobalamin-dependent methionine synthase I